MSMSDYKKPMDSYTWAKRTGHNDGTMSGMFGEMDRRQEQEARARASADREERQRKAASDDSGAKVICTELHRQGLMSREDHERCARHAREHLTGRHLRGYHLWALPVVRHMRRSSRATTFWRYLAQARADHIASLYGDDTRRNRLGAILCVIGHPACRLIGKFVAERDWRAATGTGAPSDTP
jgi:hypothetical protein